jgi:uncharacterized protein (DUF1330 family)
MKSNYKLAAALVAGAVVGGAVIQELHAQATPVVIEFGSLEQAKAWKASPTSKEVDAIRDKTTKSSQYLVEGI